MLYVDIPSRSEFSDLVSMRGDACVSIYLETTPVTRDTEASRIELGNLIREAERQLKEINFDKRRLAALTSELRNLVEDGTFWITQANSLAIFATPDRLRTYRLANKLVSMVQVADRFHLKPLFRAITFTHSAFVLALSENAVRLIELNADLPPAVVEVPGMPRDLASLIERSSLDTRTFTTTIHDSDRQYIRLQQYVRKIDAALRPILSGRETPLIVAATDRTAAAFAHVNSYPHLLEETISISPDRLSEHELAERARPLLDKAYAKDVAEVRELFDRRTGERRTTTDVSDAARAATFGAIETLLVDIDSVLPGFVDDETGAIEFADSENAVAYGIIDEIAARAFATGAKVLGVRRADIPSHKELAAILRYPH